MSQDDLTRKAALVRRFRTVAVLAAVHAAAFVVTSIATKLLVGLAGSEFISGEFWVGYNYLTYFLYYGIQIAVFVLLVGAAKHLQPTNILLKVGGIVGVVGAALMFIVLTLSTVYSYVGLSDLYDPAFSETGWMKILLIVCGNPISQTALPWIAPIGLIACAASFFAHSEKTVKAEAIALAAVVAVERIAEWIPMSSMIEGTLSGVLNFAAAILTTVLFASLAKHYKQA